MSRVACIPVARCGRCKKDFIGMHAGLCRHCDAVKARHSAEAKERQAEYWAEWKARKSEEAAP